MTCNSSQEPVAEPTPAHTDQCLVRVSPVKDPKKRPPGIARLPGLVHTTQENINKMFRVHGKRKASEVEAGALSRSNTMTSLASGTSTDGVRAPSPTDALPLRTSETTPDRSQQVPEPRGGLNQTSIIDPHRPPQVRSHVRKVGQSG